jgi:hypothetical protein
LETNNTENDWSDLVNFIDKLNNTAIADLPSHLEPILDVDNIMQAMAINSLFADVESYGGSASEYFLYHRADTGRFVFINWDLNECLGMTIYSTPKVSNAMTMDPFWLPDPSKYGTRPLLTNLWAIDSYKKKYLRQLARMLREGFDETTMSARITQLADLIRSDVYNDTKKYYTNANFETNLTNPVKISSMGTNVTVNGVLQFVQQRHNYLKTQLQSFATVSDIRLNELMSVNISALADEAGDFDPWIEIYNQGPGTLSTSGFYLTDTTSNPTKWALPVRSLADGAFQILWLDNETSEGTNHVNFRLNASGGNLYLYYASGSNTSMIDSISYPALESNRSLIRMNHGDNLWLASDVATPSAENPALGNDPWAQTALLRINELMAANKGYSEDPDEPGEYPDWFEIYNPGTVTVDMSGMFFTGKMNDPAGWRVPQGVTIAPGGYLVFWADADPGQGNMHTNFKLDGGGEQLDLFKADGVTLIDTVMFPAQIENISYGRKRNSVNEWTYYDNPFNPTPSAANGLPASATLAIAAGGDGTASTKGLPADVQVGYAAASVDSGAIPYGIAIYNYSQNGIIVSEAGVPASPPTQWARIFIDYRSGVEALPGQAAGTVDINTGIAIANTSSRAATVFYTLRGLNGAMLASGYGTLPAGAHDARFIDSFSVIATGFNLPSNFATVIQFGTLEISSDQDVSITALRMIRNQRSEALYTSTPVADLTAPFAASTQYFPHMANGGGYVTTVMLLNTSDYNESGTLNLYDNNGSALDVTDRNGVMGSSFAYSIHSKGAWVFETNGLPSSTVVGSMQIVPNSGNNAPVGAGVYRYTSGGITVSESGIPAATATTHAGIYIDLTSGHNTGVAIAGIDDTAVNVSAHAYGMDGSTAVGGTGTISLSGNGHYAAFAGQIISGLPEGFVGVLDLQAATPFAALTIRSLENNRSDFLITTFPLADLTQPAPSPIVFPQIADGGGYTTQFILLSAGGAVQSSVSILRNDGSFYGVIP